MDHLISIIIPVYNVENLLPLTLNSVLNQSYQNLEIILIDDGSTDTSLSICEEYAKKDVRIKVFHQENSGVSVARNIGLSFAKGEYIGFVDSDDMIHPDMFAKLLGDMLCFNVDLAVCDTAFISTDVTEIPTPQKNNRCTEKYISIKTSLLDILWGDNERKFYCIWDKLYKKAIIDNYNICFHSDLRIGEDTLFVISYLLCCNSFSINYNIYYNHRIRPGSLMRSHIEGLADQQILRVDMLEKFMSMISGDRCLMQEILFSFKQRIPMSVIKFGNKSMKDLKNDLLSLKRRSDVLDIFYKNTRTKSEMLIAPILHYIPVNIASLLIYWMYKLKKL
mgnify:FL=1